MVEYRPIAKFVLGRTVPSSTENEIYDNGWQAVRKNGRCTLESEYPGYGDGIVVFEISDEDFETLKSNHQLWSEVYGKYGGIIGDAWQAYRTPSGIDFIINHGRGCYSADISESDFNRLRQDNAYANEVRQKYKLKTLFILGETRKHADNVQKSIENEVYEAGWSAIRKDGHCYLNSNWPGHGGGRVTFEIDEEDFERLKADHGLWKKIYDKYDSIVTDSWSAWHAPGIIIFQFQSEGNLQSAEITQSDFDFLRRDHKYADKLRNKHKNDVFKGLKIRLRLKKKFIKRDQRPDMRSVMLMITSEHGLK